MFWKMVYHHRLHPPPSLPQNTLSEVEEKTEGNQRGKKEKKFFYYLNRGCVRACACGREGGGEERRGLHERVDGPHREIFFVFFWRF